MYRHIIWIVALGVICVITMTLSFIGILWNPWGEGPIQAVFDLEREQIRIQAEYNVRTAIQVMGVTGFLATGVLGYMLFWQKDILLIGFPKIQNQATYLMQD